MKKSQFFLLGGYGCENVGDDAMLYALLQEINRINSDANFTILSGGYEVIVPSQVKDKVKYVKLPSLKKPSYLAILGEISRSSVVIIGGGSQMFDYGRLSDRLTVFLMLLSLGMYSKLLGKKLFFLSIGLGPFTTRWGEFLSKTICRLADYITVREETSYKTLLGWVFADKSSLAFDLAALMEPYHENFSSSVESPKVILGISLAAGFENYYNDREKDLLLVKEIAGAVNAYIKRNPRLEVWLFIFQGETKYSRDTYITRLLQEQLQIPNQVKFIRYNPDPREMLAQIARCTAFIGMKHHSSVFAYLGSVPQIIIDCHPKCKAFGKEIGLPEEGIMSMQDILDGRLGERLKDLLEHPEKFQATLAINSARERAGVTTTIFQEGIL